ncbi:uncharacterized protein LOC141538238, partial [Cotesia typhae]|uniref:uncharacterized protein LOC141538238 n=1 Tax=Cotesia typhae TaxID=2053667 RepID=UPI003D684BC1
FSQNRNRNFKIFLGHVTVIGHYSGLLVTFNTRDKPSIKCYKGHSKDDHDFQDNYDGSSKSMKTVMAVETLMNNPAFAAEKVRLDTLIADNDSSTIARLRREFNHFINKWINKNYAATTLTKKLYELKLSKSYVDYFKYCFGCVLEKHRNDEISTKEALLNIVPYAFDEHAKYGEWCGYHINPVNYKHKILPNVNSMCVNSKERIFKHDDSKQSTKKIHYGGSESNDFRAATAICEQNVGFTFIEAINDKLKYSSLSKHFIKFLVNNKFHKKKKKSSRSH